MNNEEKKLIKEQTKKYSQRPHFLSVHLLSPKNFDAVNKT
jgi:hypothetical protein